MATHCYEFSPFGTGIFCTECQYPLKHRSSISEAIGHHESNATKNHVVRTGLNTRFTITERYNAAMKNIADDVHRNPTESINILSRYLEPMQEYSYCSHVKCCIPVFDITKHCQKKHGQFCTSTVSGYVPKNWKRNNPMVVKHPIDANDKSLFSATFWSYYCTNKESDDSHDSMYENVGLRTMIVEQLERYDRNRDVVTVMTGNQRVEPNLWLLRTCWDTHLTNDKMNQYLPLLQHSNEDEQDIHRISTRITKILADAVAFVGKMDSNNAALFEVQRIREDLPINPFNINLTAETWNRYSNTLKTIIMIVFRMEMKEARVKTTYKLTSSQTSKIALLLNDDQDIESNGSYIDMMLSLIDQEIANDAYDCVFLSAVSIFAIKDDLRFATAAESTQFFAAVFAMFRVLILYKAMYFDSSENVSFYGKVQHLTKSLLAHPTSSKRPGPISWMMNAFNYGARISREENVVGICSWDGDQITRGKVTMSITGIRHMLSTTAYEADQSMLLLLNGLDSELSYSDLPPIQWTKLIDDANNKKPGYSFLNEPMNSWLQKDSNFVSETILKCARKSALWYEDGVIRKDTLHRYEVEMKKFRDKLHKDEVP